MMEKLNLRTSEKNLTYRNRNFILIALLLITNLCRGQNCKNLELTNWKQQAVEDVQNQMISDSLSIRKLDIASLYTRAIRFIVHKTDYARGKTLNELCRLFAAGDSNKALIVEHYWHGKIYGHSILIFCEKKVMSSINDEVFSEINFLNFDSGYLQLNNNSHRTTFDDQMRKMEDLLIITEIDAYHVNQHVIISPTMSQINTFFK